MGGSIFVTSEIGKGSRFSFSLVVKKCKENEPDLKDVTGKGANSRIQDCVKKANILLIEDDYVNRSILEKFFYINGVKLYTAQNTKEGLEILKNERIDLLLLDIQLPDLNGYEITNRIRLEENTQRHLPIIATNAEKP